MSKLNSKEIDNVIELLQTVQYIWADQTPNDGQMISDSDAITQTIECLQEYKKVRKWCGGK